MYIKYGTFQFDPGEANLSVRAEFVRSPRSYKQYQRVRYDIDGEVCIDGQYDISTRLNEIVTAFSTDGFDIGLYHDNDTASEHFLATSAGSGNLTGNQVLYKQFPKTTDAEYTTGRKFQLAVGALLYDIESSIVDHQDSLFRIGNAGPVYEWKWNKYWSHYAVLRQPSSLQHIVHSGYRIAMDTYPLPVTPYYSPPFEANYMRKVRHVSPVRFPQGYTEFKTMWEYHYFLPTFDDITTPYAT